MCEDRAIEETPSPSPSKSKKMKLRNLNEVVPIVCRQWRLGSRCYLWTEVIVDGSKDRKGCCSLNSECPWTRIV